VFQDFKLVRGTWQVRNEQGQSELVRPQDIAHSALLTVEGELDDISGSGQTAAAHGLCASIPDGQKQHLEVKGAGHYGIFSGRRWREVVYPKVRSFIKAHQPAAVVVAEPVAAPAPAATPAAPAPTPRKAAAKRAR
jgi:poly(3-hydroxybutyrate) depolymerase